MKHRSSILTAPITVLTGYLLILNILCKSGMWLSVGYVTLLLIMYLCEVIKDMRPL